ncbi:receptor-type tyrosine-protein phosphatase R isoform X6 [Myotis daubentonii]|uniref:receptor-type tyrosine-protein phosphatase R isoform X6 n=1 Tax=Myotis daubentonii TaxID=98922 RepID=UPI0028730D14|nr:receptor-type tyrosine-protein phosphatase R isoform X6 [Myotis daubentonii]
MGQRILYRLKEKFQLSLRQDKEKNQEIHLSPLALQPAQSEAKTANSMVQPEQAPKVLSVVVDPQGRHAPEIKATTSVCPSPFKMKPIGLQERRGSNVSLTLDMSSLGNVEPFVAVPTPREKVAMEYLQSASRILTRSQLRDVVASSHLLQSEFMEIPMNFVDPKEIDIPRHGTKNRYKTILPNPLSRVCLRPKNVTDSLSTYINANYIRGYSGREKAFIATQGPMINTVNDFWQMVWQEDSPVIVMITKLKEKNEKCVLYWPEKRGIYGKVEVLVINVNECDNYTVRNLVLKQGSHTQHVKHYWYTSWPDHKTPDSAQPLLQLMLDVEEDRLASAGRGPVVVHCSAGIGRTGCFIATSIGCRQLKEEGVVDPLSIVCQLRVDRKQSVLPSHLRVSGEICSCLCTSLPWRPEVGMTSRDLTCRFPDRIEKCFQCASYHCLHVLINHCSLMVLSFFNYNYLRGGIYVPSASYTDVSQKYSLIPKLV